MGKRLVCANIEMGEENRLSIVLVGNTWAFRSKLDAAGVSGGYLPGEGDSRKYVRVLKDMDSSDEGHISRVQGLFTDVFGNLAVRVSVDGEPNPDSPNAALLEKLHELPCCHFNRNPEASQAS